MISYAGQILDAVTPEQTAWIEATISTEDVFDFVRRTWPGPGALSLGFPPLPRARHIKTETLWWPRGASNFAVGYYVVNQTQLAAIRSAVQPSSTQYLQQNLVLNDGQYSLTVPMWMLPARPLQQIPLPNNQTGPSGGDLFLLTLVDSRFFWWIQAATIAVTPGTTTWDTLYAEIATALTVLYCPTLTVDDPVPAAYLKPTSDYATNYQYLPVLLDAVAQSTGMKIVVDPTNGNVRAMSAANAALRQAALLTTYPDLGPYTVGTPPLKIAGGRMALTNLRDPANINDLNTIFPKSVTVTFPQTIAGVPSATPYAVTENLSALISSTLTEFIGITGFPGSKVINTTTVYDGTNGTQINALAAQAAVDFYRWSASKLDLKMYGMLTWTNDALSWSVEWTSRVNEYSVRIQRPPWNDGVDWLSIFGSAGSSTNISNTTINFNNDTITVNNSSITLTNDTITINNSDITLDSTTSLTINGFLEICGYQFWCCVNVAVPSAATNDWNLPALGQKTWYVITSAPLAPSTITGIIPANFKGAAGPQLIVFKNQQANGVKFVHQSGASSAANQIDLSPAWQASGLTLKQFDVAAFWWDFCQDHMWQLVWTTVEKAPTATSTFRGARIWNSSNQSLNIGSNSTFTFDTATSPGYDTESYFNGSTGFVIPQTDYYSVGADVSLQFSSNFVTSGVYYTYTVAIFDSNGIELDKVTQVIGTDPLPPSTLAVTLDFNPQFDGHFTGSTTITLIGLISAYSPAPVGGTITSVSSTPIPGFWIRRNPLITIN